MTLGFGFSSGYAIAGYNPEQWIGDLHQNGCHPHHSDRKQSGEARVGSMDTI